MSHDHDGIADDPRSGQQPEVAASAAGVEEPDGGAGIVEASSYAGAADDRRSPGIEKVAEIAELLEGEGEDILKAVGLATKIQHSEIAYSGAVIPPMLLENCDSETRERYLRMMEWNTTDESKRQDRLVDSEIEQAKKGPGRTVGILVFFGMLAFISFMVTENEASFLFLSVHIVTVLANLVADVRSKSSRPSEKLKSEEQ